MDLQQPKHETLPLTDRQRHLEEALQRLARLLKAIRYYPLRHPALAAAAESARQGFAPLLTAGGETLVFTIRKDLFLVNDQAVAAGNLLLKKFAHYLFARRIQTLLFLPELSAADLRTFARCLALDGQTIQGQGGIKGILNKAVITTIWVNETDLSLIRRCKETLEERKNTLSGDEDQLEEEFDRLLEKSRQAEGQENEQTLELLLQELRGNPGDSRYRQLLQEMVPLVRSTHAEGDSYLVLEALELLYRDSMNAGLSPLRKELARQTLEQLLTDDMLGNLVELLCTRGLADEIRGQIFPLLAFLPDKMVPRLMDRLVREDDLLARRLLIEALIRQGSPAAPMLSGYLNDPRWFVVRNAVTVLGEIRDPHIVSLLPPLLRHSDIRVARETVRALTKIGGQRVVGILLSLVEGEDEALARQALLSLGAIKSPAAVPNLLKLVNRPDPMGKRTELKKEAIKALGEIGAAEAVPSLATLLRRRRLWRSRQFNELRAAAASALGDIGASAALPALEAATEGRAEIVVRAAANAIKQLKK